MAIKYVLLYFVLCFCAQYVASTSFTVLEEQDVGTWVGNITRRGSSKYYFSETNEYFQINPDNAVIYTKAKIDREILVKDEFHLVVLSSSPIYATEVTIKVIDINDHAPKFKHPVVNLSISESLAINTLIPIESASDPDSGTNTIANYTIVNNGGSNKFSLELILNLLHLKLKSKLDRETQDSYTLNISAYDEGKPKRYGYMVLNITVSDTNDNSPMFNPTTFRSDIYENAAIGTVIHQAKATDSDIGKNGLISYSINLYNREFAADLFHINSSSGLITLSGKLDYEKKTKYTIHVIAKDSGSPALDGRATVVVNVKNINDNPPTITNANNVVNLTENFLHEYFSFLQVSDLDSNILAFNIISGNEDDKFKLDSFGTGSYFLSLKSNLDRETKSKYVLKFRAFDDGSPQLTTDYTLTINVLDDNDNKPVFKQNSYNAIIPENCAIGTYVGDVSAVDNDLGLNSKIKYSILSGNERKWFRISSYSGLITTDSASIDFDILPKPSILLEISANDSGTPSLYSSIIFNITIQDLNDNSPVFNNSVYKVNVNESASMNSLLLRLQASDKDHGSNGHVAYKFSYQSEKIQSYFEIKRDTGEIFLKKKLDFNRDRSYEFLVTAEDAGNPIRYSRTKVIVSVLDVDNFSPVFDPKEYFVNVLAANSKGYITTITAIDHDSGVFGEMTYSVDSGDCCSNFIIGEKTGQLNSTKNIQAGIMHRLVIKARNKPQTQQADATVYVIALGSFDSNPAFTRDEYVFNVVENAAGKLVGQVKLLQKTATKLDIVYTIVSGNGWQFFKINEKGEILTKKSLDREQFSRFMLIISARTNTSLPLTAQTKVTIFVDDVNDNSPEFANHNIADFTIKENAAVGSYILTVNANDPDTGRNSVLKYSIIQPTTDRKFEIDAHSGKVFVGKNFLNEKVDKHIIDLEISDSGLPARTVRNRIYVAVIDYNNNYPKFSAKGYSVKITSNLTVNTKFLQVKAIDMDFGRNGRVLYKIVSGNTGDAFGIFPSGWLFLKQMSLSKQINYYSLSIEAYDSGVVSKSTKVQVSIFVGGTGGQKIFKKSSYEISFKENLPSGSIVGKMLNNIADNSGVLSFSLLQSSPYFQLAQDGVLKSKVILDREKIVQDTGSDVITSLVNVEEIKGTLKLKETCIVSVKVIDENDNGPTFSQSTYTGRVREDASSGTYVLLVTAVDSDSSQFNAIRYELQTSANVPFALDASTGILSVSSASVTLDRESKSIYNLTVLARDLKNTSMSSACRVLVYVSDANDNSPEFKNKQTTVTVKESVKVGSTIFRFTAVDKDEGLNSFVKYSVVDNTNSGIFDINAYSGELYLLKQLDYEVKTSHLLSIIATDLGTPTKQASISFTIHVSDENDNYPVFQVEPSVIYTNENVPLSTEVGRCSASDADSGNNKLIRYSIITQKPDSGAFAVDPVTCAITNNLILDREINEFYEITMKAEDQSDSVKQRLSTTKTIRIVVLDLNDNAPVFVPPLGNGFARTSNVSWQAVKLLAIDPDAGVNGTVTYSIVSGLDSACFEINQVSGIVTVKAPLSVSKKVFKIDVKATDKSIQKRSSTALITLFVLDTTANAPSCTSATHTVNEGVNIGSNVFRVQATSPESSSNMRYFIKGGNTENTFLIDSSTGWISNRKMIDYEKGPRVYNLIVTAVELSGSLPRTTDCNVNLQISDINDNDPEFNSSINKITVMENIAVSSEIYKASATDKDSGNNGLITYSIIGGNSLSVFSINSNTGKVYIAKTLDREITAGYNLTISASDRGTNPRQKSSSLIVNVGDYNDNSPKFNQSYYSFEIRENMPINTIVGLVFTSDGDVNRNGEVFYKISDFGDVFSVNGMTGEIRLARTIDYETMPNYILDITASDYGKPRLLTKVRVFINVVDVNDNCPVFTKQTYAANIAENSPVGMLVATVNAKDEDSGSFGIVNYSFQSGNIGESFAVSKSGEIRTLKILDREKKDVYVLRVAGKDQRSMSEVSCFSFATVTVTVGDVNDNSPVFSMPLIARVSEDKTASSVIYKLNATDIDKGVNATVVYSMVKPNPFEDVFDVYSDGKIYLKSRLDYETKKVYNFQVIASDRGSPPRTTLSNFTVIVVDTNDNSPVISKHKSTINLPENTTIGTTVMQFTAVDKDSGENARITFSILSGNHNLSFGIDSEAGVLFINKELDHETQRTYVLEIETKDNGVPQKRGLTTLNVIVSDVNDNKPKFNMSMYNVSIVENSAPRFLIQVTALDTDIGDNGLITYSLKQSAYSNFFSINYNSGRISTLTKLDREALQTIQLTVIARDRGVPSLEGKTIVYVEVLDENDNYPVISPQHSRKSIKENLPANVEVQKLSIKDADYGVNSTLTYELLNNFGRFKLAKSGDFLVISTTTNLDREITEAYNLSVIVKDSGTPKLATNAYVSVIVLDDNDFPPVFSSKKFNVKIQAGSAAQTFVTKLVVTDKDIGENARFRFAIISGNTSYFDIEQQTGIITTKLAVPQSAAFEIKVQVSDPVKTDFKDTATVSITTATGYPKFSHGNQYTSVSESSLVSSQIMQINATSEEIGPAGKINYFIYSGNVDKAFVIDQTTGVITVARSLDYEKKAIYSLWIEAQDSSNPPLSSFVKLVITIINEMDSAPRITAPTKTVKFIEQQGINALVTQVKAVDLDNPQSTTRIRYKFDTLSLSLPFSINEISGEIRSTAVLDREVKSAYNMSVAAYPVDQAWRISSIMVHVSIEDINDNPPIVHSPRSISISEDLSVGSTILTINATDKDIGVNKVISFRLISSTFQIDSKTGKITLRNTLDRELQSSYLLSISVKDITFETIHELTISITDVNDSPPYFSPAILTVNVSENTAIGQSFGEVVSKDKDTGLYAMSFYYIEPRSGYGIFEINSKNGSLSLKKQVKFIKPRKTGDNEYKFTVYARNIYRPFYIANASLTIHVTDYNYHAPIFTKSIYNVYVLSTANIGHTVTTLQATDTDYGLNALVNFAVLRGNGTNLFRIDAANVKVKASLSPFANKVLQLVVEARDSGTPVMSSAAKAIVTITVVEANNFSPVFNPLSYQKTVAESYGLFKEIVRVTANDQDNGRNGMISYYITNGNTDGRFFVGVNNGSIYAIKPLDYESIKSYTLTVQAKDSAPLSPRFSTATVQIQLTDVNDNRPMFTAKTYEASVAENEPVKTSVLKVSATDKDRIASNKIVYSIDDASKPYFGIDRNTGLIETKVIINYEQISSFNVQVQATDNGSPTLSSSVIVKVNVIGKNEFPPKFKQNIYNFTVAKSAVIGHVIGKVQVTDQDKGIDGIPRYLPRESFSSLPFAVDSSSGDIRVAGKLSIGKYTLKLFVKNVQVTVLTPQLIDEASIGIEVVGGNEPPSFSQLIYAASVKEDANVGNSVLKVTAIDKDAKQGGIIRYEIMNQQPLTHFSIDANTGVISVASKLDRETIPSYNLTIKAIDNGINPAFNTTQVRITLLDVNDMPPEVTTCSGSVYENATINTVAAKAFVLDKDLDPNRGPFSFRVSNSNEFGIVLNSGDIFVKSSLDRESRSVYNVSIYVTDNGTPSLTSRAFCIIKVLDVSDTAPRPRSVRVIVNNLGDFSVGGLLGDVSPIDPDLSDAYTCQLNKSSSLFTFESSSCKLHAASHRNTRRMYVYYSAVTHNAQVTGNKAEIDFISLRNATVDKMFVFRLQGITASNAEFTNNTLVSMSGYFTSISPGQRKILIIGYNRHKDILDVLLAMLDSSSYVLPAVSTLEQLVDANIPKIVEMTKASGSQIPHSACSPKNPCLNNGVCTKLLKLNNNYVLHSSETIIFHSVGFNSTFSCRCKPGYHGTRCEYTISSCIPNPCVNGGLCKYSNSVRYCVCSGTFTGQYCESDVNECSSNPCKNNGVCQNTFGGYKCNCPATHTGKHCENLFDPCRPSPCLNAGTCSPSGSSFACSCRFGYKGKTCEIAPMTFEPLSYLSVSYTSTQALNISFEFATYQTDSLLFYGYHKTITGVNSPFVALEIVNSYLRFSFSFGVTLKRKTLGSVKASDGNWHAAKLFLSGQKLTLSLDKMEDYLTLNEATKTPDLGGAPLFIGGVESIKPIQDRPKQVSTDDFVGCMRKIHVNGRLANQSTSLKALGVSTGCTESKSCTGSPCKKGKCVNDWNGFQCQCYVGYAGSTCGAVAKPFTFGGSSFVMFKLKDSYRRKLQLAEAISSRRRRREVVTKLPTSSSVSVQLRTRASGGIIMYAKDVGGSFTALYIKDGQVHYRFDKVGQGSGSMSVEKPLVNDGMWHNISLTAGPKSVAVVVDGYQSTHNSFSVSPHQFYSKNTDALSIAGSEKPVTISGSQLATFNGCLNNISLNGENLSLQQSDKFNITQKGPVSNSCPGRDVCGSNPCVNPILSYCVDIWEAYNCVNPGKCAAKPCKNSGVCIPDGTTSYTCKCRGNFTGRDCAQPLVCLTSPCKSGESCVADSITIFRCVLISKPGTGLGTTYIVLIVVLTIIVVVFIFLLALLLKRRKEKKIAQTFKGDFTDSRDAIELKETQKTEFSNHGYESEQSLESSREPFKYDNEAYLREYEGSEYDNEANMRDSWKSGLDLISKRNSEFISKSQPVFHQPPRHREATHKKGSNRSLPVALFVNEHGGRSSNKRLDQEAHLERQRNERILQDLQGFHEDSQQYDRSQGNQFVNENGVFGSRPGSTDALSSAAKKFPSMPKIQLGTTTPPFESGFESTGSDVDSEREPASVTDVGMENASSQLELYDLEVASIGFSEMSWQNDNKSLREYRRENVERFRHFAPQVDLYDRGSTISDRNTRSDLDRLSDVVERDSSSESDGSFTCSEYEYGDERISSNKLKRKRLVFSTQPKHADAHDSDVDSSFRPRRNSHCSSMTSLTDIGSINPGLRANTNVTPMPPINWDELLNWGMKYENLADVYRALASLDHPARTPTKAASNSRGNEAVNRSFRLQPVSDRDSSAHSSQELHQRPAVLFSSTPAHEEEYV